MLPALQAGYDAHEAFLQSIRGFGANAIKTARELGRPIFVLAGRPYHIDPEVNHGIHHLLTTLGGVVLTEDCISLPGVKPNVNILNQWTYHSRLYSAAEVVTRNDDMQLIQLVSFGCGLDAVTTDEVQEILERGGKFYTQIKIDEIKNLGAARIRLRSLLEAMKGGVR
jgi:predicted nucleotide-binding protein (sugar kinase/HSP70/actin superfamily)